MKNVIMRLQNYKPGMLLIIALFALGFSGTLIGSAVSMLSDNEPEINFRDEGGVGYQPDSHLLTGPIKVGEIENMNISLRYQDGLDLQKTISYPGASYIKVHIASLDLRAGDTITVSDPGRNQVFSYPGSPFTVHPGDQGGFWAISIPGDTALIQIHTSQSDDISIPPSFREFYQKSTEGLQSEHLGIEIDKYIRGFPESESLALSEGIESTCGTDQRTDVVCYEDSHPTEYEKSHAVARLLVGGQSLCTGWRASDQNRIFTNEHCITDQDQVVATEVRFNYQRTACGSGDLAAQTVVTGNTLLADSYTYDMALFTVNDFESIAGYGYLELDVRAPVLGEEIYIPQHGGGNPKQFGIESDVNMDNVCRIDDEVASGRAANTDTGYFCDTTGGSSGSPVLARSSNGVIALHHFGINGSDCSINEMNQGVRIDQIWPLVEEYFVTPDVGPLVYHSHSIDDDSTGESSGNNDGIASCGETIELFVDLFNQGSDGATRVQASISTRDPHVSWLQNTSSSYPDINGGSAATNSDDFEFSLSPDTPDAHTLTFNLEITDANEGSWNDTFDIPVTCAALPAAPVGLTATARSSEEIELNWTDNAIDETAYHIERSTDGSSGWIEIDTVSADSSSYRDSGLDCSSAYHYRVRAYRSGDDRYSEYSNVDDASTFDCLTFPLSEDWNLLALPLQPSAPYTAQSLLDQINNQGSVCTEVVHWLNSAWDGYRDGLGFNNFEIVPGEGYFIQCASGGTWTTEGSLFTESIPLELAAGWNLVGIPFPGSGHTAQELLDDINDQGSACSEVGRWVNGAWETHMDGNQTSNFSINPERGYFIRCASGGSYIP